MIDHVPPLVHLAALDQSRLADMTAHRRRQRLASVQHIQPKDAEVQRARRQILEQRAHHAGVLRRSFAQAQHDFAPVRADAQGHDHLPIPERRAVDQHRTQSQLAQRTFHQLLQLLPAGLDEAVAHRRLLHPVGFTKLFHHRSIVARRQPAHHLVPDRVLQRRAALEQLVTAQPLLAIFRAAQTGSPNRHLLPVHYAVTVFFPPAMSATLGVLLMTLSSQVPNFLLHDQVHQRQSGLAQQVADSFLQKSHDLGHGKDHWMLRFSSRANWRNCCTARCWSIWYRLFIATLFFFLAEKLPSAHYDRGCESRYFLRINGYPRSSYDMGS